MVILYKPLAAYYDHHDITTISPSPNAFGEKHKFWKDLSKILLNISLLFPLQARTNNIYLKPDRGLVSIQITSLPHTMKRRFFLYILFQDIHKSNMHHREYT